MWKFKRVWLNGAAVACVAAWLAGGSAAAEPATGEAAWRMLKDGPAIALIRHARAPGAPGDPAAVRLDDCGTQRNLDAQGRAQAKALGEAFRKRAVNVAAVLSSRWCRCMETARLAFDRAEAWPILDSLYGRYDQLPARAPDFRARVRAWTGPGVLALVSHGANISALTGIHPGEGEVVVLRPDPAEDFIVVGRIQPGD